MISQAGANVVFVTGYGSFPHQLKQALTACAINNKCHAESISIRTKIMKITTQLGLERDASGLRPFEAEAWLKDCEKTLVILKEKSKTRTIAFGFFVCQALHKT